MRASRVFSARPERAIVALAQLCEERKDDEIVNPDGSNQISPSIPPRMSPMPTQTPHITGSSPTRLNADATPHIPQFARNLAYQQQAIAQRLSTLPENATADHPNRNHSAETPTATLSACKDGINHVYPPNAVQGVSNDASSDTSDIITDDEMMETFLNSVDDVRSYLDESPELTRAPSPASLQPVSPLPVPYETDDISEPTSQALLDGHRISGSGSSDSSHVSEHMPFPLIHLEPPQPAHVIPSRIDTIKRASPEIASLSTSTIPFGYTHSSSPSYTYYHRQQASPSSSHFPNPGNQRQQQYPRRLPHNQSPQTVFYETNGPTPFRHPNHISHLNHYNHAELAITHPYHHAHYSATPFHQQFGQSPQHQQRHEGPTPGPSRQSVFGPGGESISVKNLPQHVLSARKRNSRRGSISDGSSGRLSWKEAGGSINDNTRSNTPTTSSMTPPHPRSSSRDSLNLSRPPSRTQHSHSTSNVTVKSGTKQHQNSVQGQSVHNQSYRIRNGSVPSSPVVHQDPSSPLSSPLQQQRKLPFHLNSKLHLRKDPRTPPLSGVHLNSSLRNSSGQLPNPQGGVSSNDQVSEIVYNSRTTGSPCASVSNGSATTGSAIDSSPGSISSTSSSLQSTFNRSMTDDLGFEVVSPFQSRIGRLPSSQQGYGVRRDGEAGVEITAGGISEGYRIVPQNLQELRTQKEKGGRKDWRTFQGRAGGDGQVQLQSEESTRKLRQAWKELQARRVVDRNSAMYHQPQVGMTVGLEGRKASAVGDKHCKKW